MKFELAVLVNGEEKVFKQQGVKRSLVLVVNFSISFQLNLFALLLLYLTKCTMWRLYSLPELSTASEI